MLMREIVRSWRGEKQTTRQIPGSASATIKSASLTQPSGVSGRSAAKSFSNTKVLVYRGLRAPPARVFPGHK
jgi:hypothetical protein